MQLETEFVKGYRKMFSKTATTHQLPFIVCFTKGFSPNPSLSLLIVFFLRCSIKSVHIGCHSTPGEPAQRKSPSGSDTAARKGSITGARGTSRGQECVLSSAL